MASGRMLQRKISKSHDVAMLMERVSAELGMEHGPFAALLFTWCIAHADREGRMHGDPRIVRADVFPLVEHITVTHIATYLQHMQVLGLIAWYEVDGRRWIAFPKFDDSQPGLRKDKESKSVAPEPNHGTPVADARVDGPRTELGRSKDGVSTDKLPAQKKGKEEKFKGREVAPAVLREPTPAFQVVEAWRTGWIERFKPVSGRAPDPTDADWKQAKNLLAAHAIDEALALVIRFLDDTDKFVAERGHMLRDLPSRLARYAKGDGPLFHAKPNAFAPSANFATAGDKTSEYT